MGKKEKVQEPVNLDKVTECPTEACQELQENWLKGIKGVYSTSSKYCKSCGKDFPRVQEICKLGAEAELLKKTTAKAKKVSKKGNKEVNQLGHGVGTQSDFIDTALLTGGMKVDDLTQELIDRGLSVRDVTTTKKRVFIHFNHLKREHGITINKAGGIYSIQ